MYYYNGKYPLMFRFWCQKVLPLVYDDSLSYYEVLNKLTDYVNGLHGDLKSLIEMIKNNTPIEGVFLRDTTVGLANSFVTGDCVIITKGYAEVGDGGGAIFLCEASADEADNVLTYRARDVENNYYICTMINEDKVTAESIGLVGNVDFDRIVTLNNFFRNHEIFIEGSADFNLAYTLYLTGSAIFHGTVSYGGLDFAIALDHYMNHTFEFNKIVAENGTCIALLNNDPGNYSTGSKIKGDYLNGARGIYIYPQGKGINWFTIEVEYILASEYGIYFYTRDNGAEYDGIAKYWIGEGYLDISEIRAGSSAVRMECTGYNGTNSQPNNLRNQVITGITFGHLAVENSPVGIELISPSRGTNQNCGIRSVVVNNFRTRETNRTSVFIRMSGYVTECKFYPTSAFVISHIDIEHCDATLWTKNEIIAPIRYYGKMNIIAGKADLYDGLVYYAECQRGFKTFELAEDTELEWSTAGDISGETPTGLPASMRFNFTRATGVTDKLTVTINNCPIAPEGSNGVWCAFNPSTFRIIIKNLHGYPIFDSNSIEGNEGVVTQTLAYAEPFSTIGTVAKSYRTDILGLM